MLRHALSACMSQMAENPRTTRVFTVLLTDGQDGPAGWLRERERQGAVEARNRLAHALRNAVRRQQLPSDLHIERAAALLKSALSGVLRDWLVDSTALALPLDAGRIAQALIDMLSCSPSLRGPP
jgi:TetR/AcrR family acrAB operon transcriptional repressor